MAKSVKNLNQKEKIKFLTVLFKDMLPFFKGLLWLQWILQNIGIKYIIEENDDYKNIFFTEEKRFLIKFSPNKQTFEVRLTKESKKIEIKKRRN